ncbi:MAG: hypothetical protein LBD84_04620 [Campylobacteraceae bacterium]|jgi:hypothetical protein|nr:hypothetical protein [Campylobacteraceae bacterium]
MEKDFNSLFWNLLGVNHRVYDIEDIFFSTHKKTREKQFERFIKTPTQLSNEEFFKLLISEAIVFYQLRIEKNEHNCFYVEQIINIILNYKLFLWFKLDKKEIVKMLAFQIALIIEYMRKNRIDIGAFEDSLNKKNFTRFISKPSDKLDKFKFDKLASDLACEELEFKKNA